MSSKHLSTEEIQSYIQFELSEPENERIIAHLSECDTCLSLVDEKWMESSQPDPVLPSAKLEKRLMNNIHRSNLAGNFILLGLNGFLNSMIGILAPLLNFSSNILSRQRK